MNRRRQAQAAAVAFFGLGIGLGLRIFITQAETPAPRAEAVATCGDLELRAGQAKLGRVPMKSDTIKGHPFPRNERELYRGVEFESPQYYLSDVARIVFGDESAYIGTFGYLAARQALESGGSDASNARLGNGLSKYVAWSWGSSLANDLREIKAKCGENLKDERTLSTAAAYAIDRHFSAMLGDSRKTSSALDYLCGGGEREAGGCYVNYGPELFFSSINLRTALYAGRKILALRNREERGIDLSYYNYQLNGREKWYGPWQDWAEVLFPGYVRSEVDGLFYASGFGDGYSAEDRRITSAFVAKRTAKGTALQVLDVDRAKCIAPGDDGVWYYCEEEFMKGFGPNDCFPLSQAQSCRQASRMGADAPPPTLDLDRPVPVAGVLVACRPDDAACAPSEELRAAPKYSDRAPLEILSPSDRRFLPKLRFPVAGETMTVRLFDHTGRGIPLE